MFEHLDGAEPEVPRDDAFARVVRRAHRIRSRRMAVGALAALVVVAGAAGIGASVRPSPVSVPSAESAYQFNALRSPLRPGTAVPTAALTNLVFVSPTDGFALAAHQGRALLAKTLDGGDSWNVVNDMMPGGYGESDGFPGEFEFTDPSHGFLWDGSPTSAGAAPVWITNNGGATWQMAPLGPVVYDVSAIHDNVWAVVGLCNVGAQSTSTCGAVIEQSLDSGSTWQVVSPTLAADEVPPLADRVELARITRSRAYVLTTAPPSGAALYFTADAGATWTSRQIPCPGAPWTGDEVAASGTDDLWFLCGAEGSGGLQSKSLYRSSDGGSSWTLASVVTTTGTGADSLPLAGYIAPLSVGHKNLAIVSPTEAWLSPSSGSLFKTENGGGAWNAVTDLDQAEFGTGGPGNLTFISATQGWVCEFGIGVWHTVDGFHWSALGPEAPGTTSHVGAPVPTAAP